MTSTFNIEEIYMVGKESEKLNKETHCSICRNHLEENSIYDNNYELYNPLEIGICNDIFHKECIKIWLRHNKECPNCRKKWETIKISN